MCLPNTKEVAQVPKLTVFPNSAIIQLLNSREADTLADKPYNKIVYNNNYKQTHYDTLRALIPKGKLKVIKEYATEHGKSLSALTVEALEQYCNIDLSK